MSASRREREQFIARAVQHGIHYDDACKLLRFAATLQRLAEAQCNGDWPADHGDAWPTRACSLCGSNWAVTAFRFQRGIDGVKESRCPDCRATERARAFTASLCADDCARRYLDGSHNCDVMWCADFQGDPRGYVFRLHQGAMMDDDCRHGNCRHVRIGVPA